MTIPSKLKFLGGETGYKKGEELILLDLKNSTVSNETLIAELIPAVSVNVKIELIGGGEAETAEPGAAVYGMAPELPTLIYRSKRD